MDWVLIGQAISAPLIGTLLAASDVRTPSSSTTSAFTTTKYHLMRGLVGSASTGCNQSISSSSAAAANACAAASSASSTTCSTAVSSSAAAVSSASAAVAGRVARLELPEDETTLVLCALMRTWETGGQDAGVRALCALTLVSRRIGSLANRQLVRILLLPAIEPRAQERVLRRISAWTAATRWRDVEPAVLSRILEAQGAAGPRGFAACVHVEMSMSSSQLKLS